MNMSMMHGHAEGQYLFFMYNWVWFSLDKQSDI